MEESESEGERAADPGDFEWEVWEGENVVNRWGSSREGAASGTLEWEAEQEGEGEGESGRIRERLREEGDKGVSDQDFSFIKEGASGSWEALLPGA